MYEMWFYKLTRLFGSSSRKQFRETGRGCSDEKKKKKESKPVKRILLSMKFTWWKSCAYSKFHSQWSRENYFLRNIFSSRNHAEFWLDNVHKPLDHNFIRSSDNSRMRSSTKGWSFYLCYNQLHHLVSIHATSDEHEPLRQENATPQNAQVDQQTLPEFRARLEGLYRDTIWRVFATAGPTRPITRDRNPPGNAACRIQPALLRPIERVVGLGIFLYLSR